MDISIEVNGQRKVVDRAAYVNLTLRGLHGPFPDLTEETVEAQLSILLAGKKWTNVIGCFISHDEPQPVKTISYERIDGPVTKDPGKRLRSVKRPKK